MRNNHSILIIVFPLKNFKNKILSPLRRMGTNENMQEMWGILHRM